MSLALVPLHYPCHCFHPHHPHQPDPPGTQDLFLLVRHHHHYQVTHHHHHQQQHQVPPLRLLVSATRTLPLLACALADTRRSPSSRCPRSAMHQTSTRTSLLCGRWTSRTAPRAGKPSSCCCYHTHYPHRGLRGKWIHYPHPHHPHPQQQQRPPLQPSRRDPPHRCPEGSDGDDSERVSDGCIERVNG